MPRRRSGKRTTLMLMSIVLIVILLGTLISTTPEYAKPSYEQAESPIGIIQQIGNAITSNPVIRSFGEKLGLIEPEEVGIYVKPSLGSYKALKLYDDRTEKEGMIWVKPIIKIAVVKGTPEQWSFTTKVKVKSDGEVIGEKTLTKQGHGMPPKKIVMDKVTIRGKALQLLLLGQKEAVKKLLMGERVNLPERIYNMLKPETGAKQICFYADYQGVVKFEEDEEPTVKELKDIKLGCFDFEVKDTGDFEMIVEKNVTVAPLAEVMASAESGMIGAQPQVITVTHTITMPYTSYVTKYLTTYYPGQTVTITVTQPGTTYVTTKVLTQATTMTMSKTTTEYITYTMTKRVTRWKTTTTTVTTTVTKEKEIPVTTTITKYVIIENQQYVHGYSGVVIEILEPYSAFIFIGG